MLLFLDPEERACHKKEKVGKIAIKNPEYPDEQVKIYRNFWFLAFKKKDEWEEVVNNNLKVLVDHKNPLQAPSKVA